MSDIPEARRRLDHLQLHLIELGLYDEADTLNEIVSLLWRRPLSKPRAPVTSIDVDRTLAERIRQCAANNPHWSQQQVASNLGTNHGRVSEALRGER